MAIKTRPKFAGTLAALGGAGSLFGRAGFRLYPYQLGVMVRTTNTNGTCPTFGLGDFATNNYVLPCTPNSGSLIFIPNTSRLTRVTGTSGSDGTAQLTVSPAVTLTVGDFLLNIGNDTAAAPLTAPNYDGTTLTLSTDPIASVSNPLKYLQTGSGGFYQGWFTSSTLTVIDVLISDSSGVPQAVVPLVTIGVNIG